MGSASFALLIFGKKLHRKMDALEIASRNGQIPRHGRADGQHERVVVGPQHVHLRARA